MKSAQARCDIPEGIAVADPGGAIHAHERPVEAQVTGHGPGQGLGHIRELDGLRGVAALAVFMHHVCFTSVDPAGWGTTVVLLYHASEFGQSGVDIFFVLSGFLITSLLIKDRASQSFYHDFYWKRALRILPVYLLCLLGIVLFVPGMGRFTLLALLFVANFARIFHVVPSGPFWTLAIEEQFYIVWPTIVRQRSVAEVSRWAAGIGAGCMLLRVVAALLHHSNYYFTFFRCDGLAAGALLACWYARRGAASLAAGKSEVRRASGKEAAIIALSATVGLGLIVVARMVHDPRAVHLLRMLYQTGQTLLFASVVAFVILQRGRGTVAVLRSPLLTFFGLISYAFYMTHLYVLQLYDHLRGPLAAGDHTAYAMRFACVLVLTVALSLLSRYAVELPAMSLRRFVLKQPAEKAEIETPLLAGTS